MLENKSYLEKWSKNSKLYVKEFVFQTILSTYYKLNHSIVDMVEFRITVTTNNSKTFTPSVGGFPQRFRFRSPKE